MLILHGENAALLFLGEKTYRWVPVVSYNGYIIGVLNGYNDTLV